MRSAGDFRILADVEKPIRTPNVLNENEIAWEIAFPAIWIAADPQSGGEIAIVRKAVEQVTHKVSCRYFGGLKSDMRFTWTEPDGRKRILNIKLIRDLEERHVEYSIDAMEQSRG